MVNHFSLSSRSQLETNLCFGGTGGDNRSVYCELWTGRGSPVLVRSVTMKEEPMHGGPKSKSLTSLLAKIQVVVKRRYINWYSNLLPSEKSYRITGLYHVSE